MPAPGKDQVYEGVVSGFFTSRLTALSFPRKVSYHREKGPGDPGPESHQGEVQRGNDPIWQNSVHHRGTEGTEIEIFRRKSYQMDLNYLTGKIIGAAIEFHKALGPGLSS